MSNIYHRGDSLFLYVKFKDEHNNLIAVNNPKVSILGNNNQYILDEVDLNLFGDKEYCLTVDIPFDVDYSFYEVVYIGEYEDKLARVIEDFHVIPKSSEYKNAIKLYGFINQSKLGHPFIGANVRVFDFEQEAIVSESFTNLEGKWELFLYPGKYHFQFSKFGFLEENIDVEIGESHQEMQFNNVSLVSSNSKKTGTGAFLVSDKYVTKESTPLNDLSINIYNSSDLSQTEAEVKTDDEGTWQAFLDAGIYLVKVSGDSLEEEFNQTFRLKVNNEGEFSFENLTQNVGVPMQQNSIGRGTGTIEVIDSVIDKDGNPIIDVQLCVYPKNDINNLVAEDYTNPNGEWKVYLNPGNYVFEFYHPEFHEFKEDKIIK